MQIFFLKEGTGQSVSLNQMIADNAVDLDETTSLDTLMEAIGDAKYVLLGEASHGTHEYYVWRTKITQRLIKEKGFSFVGVEGDWPDCYRLNRYVKHYKDAALTAEKALHDFNRWPTWMWANWEMVAFAEWLHKYNKDLPQDKRAGIYGLDVYSLWESLEVIIKYLDKVDPDAKEVALEAWKCFEPYSENEGQSYALASTREWVPATCESEVVDLLVEIRNKMASYNSDPEAVLNMEQNATVAVDAERYYRAMIKGGPLSWNIRDHHMVDTLNRLINHHGTHSKAIIWAHNTHIGDARATDMRKSDMVNVGQLVNEQHFHDGVFSVGFGSYEGSVVAGRHWGDAMKVMDVPKAQPTSWEFVMHQAGPKNRIVFMNEEMRKLWGSREIGHRAIGVVYNPKWEHGNYVASMVPYRYDAFVYFEKTTALHPLHIQPDGHQVPETYPFGV